LTTEIPCSRMRRIRSASDPESAFATPRPEWAVCAELPGGHHGHLHLRSQPPDWRIARSICRQFRQTASQSGRTFGGSAIHAYVSSGICVDKLRWTPYRSSPETLAGNELRVIRPRARRLTIDGLESRYYSFSFGEADAPAHICDKGLPKARRIGRLQLRPPRVAATFGRFGTEVDGRRERQISSIRLDFAWTGQSFAMRKARRTELWQEGRFLAVLLGPRARLQQHHHISAREPARSHGPSKYPRYVKGRVVDRPLMNRFRR